MADSSPIENSEQPLYVCYQQKIRVLVPKIVLLLVLGCIFYLGILLNISLLELDAAQETATKTVSLFLVLIIIGTGIAFGVRSANAPYIFYKNRLTFQKKEIPYKDIPAITMQQDGLDRLFKTYALQLTDNFQLKNLPQELQLQEYIQQLIAYAKSLSP